MRSKLEFVCSPSGINKNKTPLQELSMDYAKSMMLGGEIVYSDECDFDSYKKWLLRCPICGQPVFLKQGGVKKPHFAHFQEKYSDKVEPCELRASSYGKSSQINNNFSQDRGQRLSIFREYFISLIFFEKRKIIDDINFTNWMETIKWLPNIDDITQACTEYLIIHQNRIKAIYSVHPMDINDKKTLLQQRIALEAIDYLCKNGRFHVLKDLLYYSMYRLYENEGYNKLLRQQMGTKDIDDVCNLVVKIIMFNNWIEILKEYEVQ